MKTINSEGCINNEQQNSLPHILPYSINTTVSHSPLGATFKLPKICSPNLCIPFFFFFFASFNFLPPFAPGSYSLCIPE